MDNDSILKKLNGIEKTTFFILYLSIFLFIASFASRRDSVKISEENAALKTEIIKVQEQVKVLSKFILENE
jgi:hypothetical protein